MGNSSFERHRQFARQLRRKMLEIERDAAASANQTEVSDDEDYDFFEKFDDMFENLYESKKEGGQS